MGSVSVHAAAIVSGLLAAFCAAVGIVVRQRAAQRVPAAQSDALVTALAREPSWWAGIVATVGGYVFQVLALAHGSLLLVQPLLVSSLLFALPLNARVRRQRVSWAEWGWAALLTAALAVFVLIGQPGEGHNRPPIPAWTFALLITLPLVIACIAAARRVVGRGRAMLLAAAVAILLGMVAVLTKICTHRFAIGGWHAVLTIPAPYMLVALAVTVTVVQNAALHAEALQASVPIMLVGEPVVAVLLGMVVLGEHVGVRGPGAIVLVLAVWAMVTATVALARSQASDRANPAAPQPDSPGDSDARLATAGSQRSRS